ncbi:PREDICTED: uncharacterized protein LOC108363873 [Rhagoletis zephyria]|uniref:uncharacterized protein LOC108363873 n=1 Tax=Rhagoletis zephyria TaxID=28612 RepID=UPI000811458E|nr:PREDICTED: uncharacterized protein LOC108363873 [Rhagoletis zephyria]
MNFCKPVLLLFLMFAAIEGRFEDFVIKNQNDLKRFGDYNDINDEDYEIDEDSVINLELLRQLYKTEPGIMDLLRDGSLEEIPADFMQKLQQYYAQVEPWNCENDENSHGMNVYDIL